MYVMNKIDFLVGSHHGLDNISICFMFPWDC